MDDGRHRRRGRGMQRRRGRGRRRGWSRGCRGGRRWTGGRGRRGCLPPGRGGDGGDERCPRRSRRWRRGRRRAGGPGKTQRSHQGHDTTVGSHKSSPDRTGPHPRPDPGRPHHAPSRGPGEDLWEPTVVSWPWWLRCVLPGPPPLRRPRLHLRLRRGQRSSLTIAATARGGRALRPRPPVQRQPPRQPPREPQHLPRPRRGFSPRPRRRGPPWSVHGQYLLYLTSVSGPIRQPHAAALAQRPVFRSLMASRSVPTARRAWTSTQCGPTTAR